jgi:hypothetical protein
MNFLILLGKNFKEMDMISWSNSLNIANNKKVRNKYYTLHTTYNIAIWRPAHYIPFNCDISSWMKCIISFCRNIKETKLKTRILKESLHRKFHTLYQLNFLSAYIYSFNPCGSLWFSVFDIYNMATEH